MVAARGGGGGADVRLATMSLSIPIQGKTAASTGALDDQQLLANVGSKKSRRSGHSTSNWTECEKWRHNRHNPSPTATELDPRKNHLHDFLHDLWQLIHLHEKLLDL